MKRAAAALAVAAAFSLLAIMAWRWWDLRHWRAYEAFVRVFVQPDGRVIDRTAADRTTSEAQAYTLFFALVANDRPRFEKVLAWTENNLAQGDLRAHLPAWLWGLKEDGSWGVKDANPASDADLWIAYALLEAARLWQVPRYGDLGLALLGEIYDQETVDAGAAGRMLLPAPQGFVRGEGGWQFNPSYLPAFQFARLAALDNTRDWQALYDNHQRVMQKLLVRGYAPDWYLLDSSGNLGLSPGARGSYDAIRVYLWAGMTEGGVGENLLLKLTAPYAKLLAATPQPPEIIDIETGATSGGAPIGFSAAVLPFLAKLDEDSAVRQRQRLKKSRQRGNLGSPPHYYDQALALFGEGWDTKRFRFGIKGQVIPRWTTSCCDP